MNDWSMLKKLIWLHIVKGGGIERTVKGAIVHVTNALARPAISVKCEVNPIQDLHGYDSPWPAGGGVNLLPESVVADATVNGIRFQSFGDGTIKVSGTAGAGANYQINLANPVTLPASDIYVHLLNPVANANVSLFFFNGSTNVGGITLGAVNRIYKLAQLSGATFSALRLAVGNGETVDITFSPMLCLDGTVKPFSSYSNICPISGRTSATVTRTGANVWDEEWELGSFNSQGQPSSSSTSIRCKNFIPVVSGQTYYMYSGSGKSNAPWMYGIDKSFIRRSSAYLVNQAFTIPEDVHYIKIALPGTYGTTYNHDISINYPATDTQYHPYQGNTYTIQLGDTVYGGTLDVTGGKMVVDRAMVDLGTLEYYYVSSGGVNAFRSNIGAMPVTDNSQHGITSIYPFAGTRFTSNMPNLSWMIDSQGRLFIRDYRYTDISSFVAYLSGQTIVYELATPIEITLTPTQIDMLLGENNLWADAGDLTLTYYADGNASTSEALGILLGGTYNNPGGADDVSDDEALEILLGGS